jgi:hypothetical protein
MRLSDLSDIRAGRHPVLATGDVPAVARALTIEEGDLIVGARGSATDVCLATGALVGAFVSLDLYLVRPDREKVSPQYLAAFLDLPATQAAFAGGKQGSALARLPKDALEKTLVSVPPMQSQLLIAGLALSFEDERRLFQRLSDLRSFFGRETVARAIRAAEAQSNSQRSPTGVASTGLFGRATSGLSSRFHAPARSLLRHSVAALRHQDGFHPAADAEFHQDAESDPRLVEKTTALRFGNRSSKLIERLAAEEDEAAAQEGDAHGRSGRVGAPTLGLSHELEAIRGEIKRLALNGGEMNSEGPFGRGPVVAAC